MTKTEDSRLAVVETKIDSMAVDMITLKEFLTEKVNAQEKNIGTAMTASEKAIVKAEIANDIRFEAMNKRITDSIEAINANIKVLTDNQNLNAGAKGGVKEFIGYILAAITIIGFIIAQFVGRGM